MSFIINHGLCVGIHRVESLLLAQRVRIQNRIEKSHVRNRLIQQQGIIVNSANLSVFAKGDFTLADVEVIRKFHTHGRLHRRQSSRIIRPEKYTLVRCVNKNHSVVEGKRLVVVDRVDRFRIRASSNQGKDNQ